MLNKVDRVEDAIRLHLLREPRDVESVHVSARTGVGLEHLEAQVARRLDARSSLVSVTLPLADGKSAAAVRAAGVVLEERVVGESELVLRMRIVEHALGNLRRTIGERGRIEIEEPASDPFAPGEVSA